ncbi:unnamed protein product, partial [Rotaria sordida]
VDVVDVADVEVVAVDVVDVDVDVVNVADVDVVAVIISLFCSLYKNQVS